MTPGLAERHPLKEKRRANKPLLERKRRARINDSLSDLKTLVLSSLNKDVSKYAKMEKVDILDMTVQFLKGNCFEKPADEQLSVFRAGYAECTQQIYHSIMSMDGIDHTNKYKILSKISERIHPEDRHLSPPPSPPNAYFQKPPAYHPSQVRGQQQPTHTHYESNRHPLPQMNGDPKCKKTLFNGHHVPGNQRVPPFGSQVYELPPEQMENLLLRKTQLYPGEKMPIRKVYSNVPVDEIIAKNAKLYSSEHSDIDDSIARSSSPHSPPHSPHSDNELLLRHSMAHQDKCGGVWRPW